MSSTPAVASAAPTATSSARQVTMQEYPVPKGSGPHDVAPAADGGVWYTAQLAGKLGWLDPKTGQTKEIPLGAGSAPHGVIVGPDGAPWITDGGQNAIVRVDPRTSEVTRYPLPVDRPNANLNTATFDKAGILWFTGQNGVYGRLDPHSGAIRVFDAPRGAGPYGITTTPEGAAFVSLAGSYLALVGDCSVPACAASATVFDPATKDAGTRRVWADTRDPYLLWISEWNSGKLGSWYMPGPGKWKEWKLPGANPMAYAVYVDERDMVWLTDWGANALVRFDPATETFASFPFALPNANVRQLHGRLGEVWGAMSGQDKLVVARI